MSDSVEDETKIETPENSDTLASGSEPGESVDSSTESQEGAGELDILGDLGAMPEVTKTVEKEEAPKRVETPPGEVPDIVKGRTDNQGRGYDPKIHLPELTSKGKIKMRRRGRPPAGGASQVNIPQNKKLGPAPEQGPTSQSQQEIDTQKCRMAGVAMANTLISLGRGFGGPEWDPKKDERENLEDAFSNYCIHKNYGDFPPGMALVIAVGAYAMPRFTMPQTQQRAKGMWSKFKLWRKARALKKEAESMDLKEEAAKNEAKEG